MHGFVCRLLYCLVFNVTDTIAPMSSFYRRYTCKLHNVVVQSVAYSATASLRNVILKLEAATRQSDPQHAHSEGKKVGKRIDKISCACWHDLSGK